MIQGKLTVKMVRAITHPGTVRRRQHAVPARRPGRIQAMGPAPEHPRQAPRHRARRLRVHARRKLCEIHDSHRSEVAAQGLRRIAAMYASEKQIRGEPAEVRLAVRQARTAPRVQEFGVWLKRQRARVSPKSRLGEKLAYIGNHWEGLQVFLTDGRVEMDSNVVENTIRPLALNRKNALFAGHDEGAAAWARIASLIETAKMNGVNPRAYLKATLEAIANGHPASEIDQLLPWVFTPISR